MSQKIWLSWSTLSAFERWPHTWTNHILGIKQPESPEMTEGKECHKIFTDHVTGIKKDPRVTVDLTFQKPEYKVFSDFEGDYGLYGFVDAVDFTSKAFCEYKTSSTPWSQSKFDKHRQIVFYALALGFRKAFMVTSTRDLQNFKSFYKVVSEDEIKDTEEWIRKLIKDIESGDYKRDLVEGKCPGCYWKEKCFYV